jgi:hypothetical protein
MFGQGLSRWAASLFLMFTLGWLLPVSGFAADTPGGDTDEDDQPIDVNVLHESRSGSCPVANNAGGFSGRLIRFHQCRGLVSQSRRERERER